MEFQIMKYENFSIKANYCQRKMKTATGVQLFKTGLASLNKMAKM